MKIRENTCGQCYTKIVQTGRGRTAKLCKGCRDQRADDWRESQKPKEKKPEKIIDTVGGDNA